jgi:superfamily II DNA or RNA helicase
MAVAVTIEVPPAQAIDSKVGRHVIRQLRRPTEALRGTGEYVFTPRGRLVGIRVEAPRALRIVTRRADAGQGPEEVLLTSAALDPSAPEASFTSEQLQWLRPAADRRGNVDGLARSKRAVLRNWVGKFKYVVAHDDEPGLRPPQLGAVHGVLAHWTVSDDIATVVMPTGTGKTETMIALLVAERLPLLVVVVPSRLLRDQIAEKFLTLGVLPTVGVVPPGIALPVVARLEGSIQDVAEANNLIQSSNVLVSTMQALTRAPEDVRRLLADSGSYLMIDEAHHVAARTWNAFRTAYPTHRVVQFTATPFRSDNKLMLERPAYRYPLRKAQQAGYFRPITFYPVWEFDPGKVDEAIARKAVERLDADLAGGLDHMLMARTATIDRAEQLKTLYQSITDKPAIVVHSGQTGQERRAGLSRVVGRDVRIVICVDMLGEGYDLPALKIAALHDPHRGLGITLQFIGRFTRGAEAIGDASVVANIADPKVEESIAQLYSQDADWTSILRELSEGAVQREVRRADFLQGFTEDELLEVPLQNVYPKMSTVAYRVPTGNFRPDRLRDAIAADDVLGIRINAAERVAVVVTRREERIAWADIAALRNVLFDLLILHFDAERRLLFIHASDNRRFYGELAAAVCGDDVSLIQGTEVFRALSGISRLLVATLGLRAALNRSVRFTMYAGTNVNEGLSEANFQNRTTSNLFGFGFEDGERASIGCSYRGRLWSYRIADDIGQWVDWCHQTGRKLIDSSIDTSTILRTTMTVEAITARPPGLVPIGIEWSDNVWVRSEDTIEFQFGETWVSLLEVGIDLVERSAEGPIQFRVFSDAGETEYEIQLTEDGPVFSRLRGPNLRVRVARREEASLADWFLEEPPIVRFHNGQQLARDLLLSAPTIDRPFPEDRIVPWDWSGVDRRRESQGPERDPHSIQRRVINELIAEDWDIVFNDDGTNEAADVIAVKFDEANEILRVQLSHCKFSSGEDAGHRVQDLYEVCGQAQRSVHWKGDRGRLLDHMARRNALWAQRGATRFELGDPATLAAIASRQRYLTPEFEIRIVQPGLGKSQLTDNQRDLLAATQLYLMETFAVQLTVIASA